MKYVYGPVPSRRLGRSLGIDPIPLKTCNYQCIYCQLGKTTYFTNERKNFFPVKAIICELKKAIKENEGNFDYITFVGSGEPTLYKDLKKLILMAKELSEIPICVITNGSLLYDKEIRDILISADVILPSLDAGDEKSFIKINRPHPSINFEKLIQGFIDFREIYKGKFW
ncbi:MAG: radical SAM protein, partial [Candidatus Heimdallarchaeota archaeon]